MLAVFPLLVWGQMLRMNKITATKPEPVATDKSAIQSYDALKSIRTVQSLGLEEEVVTKFADLLVLPMKKK